MYLSELGSRLLDGFLVTLQLLGWSALFATLIGTALGAFRVSPIRPLRALGTSYVNVFRNTPLVVLFIIAVFGLPVLGIFRGNFFWLAVVALSTYTAAFVCEVVRSGVNTVDIGQAEAARSIGMGFSSSLRQVIMPQAFRAVIPPLASVYIALAKNTSVAAAFGITEATFQLSGLQRDFASRLLFNFAGIALGYILIVAVISLTASRFERRVAVSR
ncbi:MAG: ABC transporter, permease protein (cluster 3, basic aa/glutamine/opines) [uncultured Nocardioidaceae bacterium]|uniref:ABC transporter, permease protein (Cluster 3, basic aa/glutamine/opines) n=1 Tax=uncultured Nocardioidaceae bacterium TaxID=253824 RepID=A0A6J4MC79_9ACTN|nr:MAG: ABC transporter, permease protein (cluster 3, basic aa/glutamine/opines) [uncultured Nocardioidaceae bacterium]